MREKTREPIPTPGEVLRHLLAESGGITQEQLAEAMKVSRVSVNQLMRGRRSVTAEMALRLGRVLDTSPQFWLQLQMQSDLERAVETIGSQLKGMRPVRRAPRAASMFVELEGE